MRLLLDENASSRRFCRLLVEAGHDVETVGDVLGLGASDKTVAAYAIATNRALVTQDQDDFHGHYRDSPSHPGLIVIYPGPAQLDSPKLVAALENVANAYSITTGLVLSLNEFFWSRE
jgi:predicted nuclease of predicted toxin-antitoxin system